jgi:hypothetical protein
MPILVFMPRHGCTFTPDNFGFESTFWYSSRYGTPLCGLLHQPSLGTDDMIY